jgi:hypothetical protein
LILIVFAVSALILVALNFVGYQYLSPGWPKPNLWAILSTTLHVLTAPFGVRFGDWWLLMSLFVIGVLVGVTSIAIYRLQRVNASTSSTCVPAVLRVSDMLAFLAAMTLLAGAIGLGRGGRGWPSGIEAHYAPIELPFFCCVYFFYQIYGKRNARRLTHGTLLLFFAIAFVAYLPQSINRGWYQQYLMHVTDRDVLAGKTIKEIVETHIKDFYFVDTPDTRKVVANGLQILQQRRIKLFQNLGRNIGTQNTFGKGHANTIK